MDICIRSFGRCYLAADANGSLCLYTERPQRGAGCWISAAQHIALTDTEANAIKQRINAPAISWADEPRTIEVMTSIQPL